MRVYDFEDLGERDTLDLLVFFERGANRERERERDSSSTYQLIRHIQNTYYRFELTHTCASLKESTTV